MAIPAWKQLLTASDPRKHLHSEPMKGKTKRYRYKSYDLTIMKLTKFFQNSTFRQTKNVYDFYFVVRNKEAIFAVP